MHIQADPTEPNEDEDIEIGKMIREDFDDLEHGRTLRNVTGEEEIMSRIAARDFSDLDLLTEDGSDEEALEVTFLEL